MCQLFFMWAQQLVRPERFDIEAARAQYEIHPASEMREFLAGLGA